MRHPTFAVRLTERRPSPKQPGADTPLAEPAAAISKSTGDAVLIAMTGLGSDALARPAPAVLPAQWWAADKALDAGLKLALAPAEFSPAAGRQARYGPFYLATDDGDTGRSLRASHPSPLVRAVWRLRAPVTSCASCTYPGATSTCDEALAHIAQRVEAMPKRRTVAVRCGAHLGHRGTLALAYAMAASSPHPIMRDVLSRLFALAAPRLHGKPITARIDRRGPRSCGKDTPGERGLTLTCPPKAARKTV